MTRFPDTVAAVCQWLLDTQSVVDLVGDRVGISYPDGAELPVVVVSQSGGGPRKRTAPEDFADAPIIQIDVYAAVLSDEKTPDRATAAAVAYAILEAAETELPKNVNGVRLLRLDNFGMHDAPVDSSRQARITLEFTALAEIWL